MLGDHNNYMLQDTTSSSVSDIFSYQPPAANTKKSLVKKMSSSVKTREEFVTYVLIRQDLKTGFGFDIKGEKPSVIGVVRKGTTAEQAGLEVGDCVITINNVNVTKLDHDKVVSLVSQSQQKIVIEVEKWYKLKDNLNSLSSPQKERLKSQLKLKNKNAPVQSTAANILNKNPSQIDPNMLYLLNNNNINSKKSSKKKKKSRNNLNNLTHSSQSTTASSSAALTSQNNTKTTNDDDDEFESDCDFQTNLNTNLNGRTKKKSAHAAKPMTNYQRFAKVHVKRAINRMNQSNVAHNCNQNIFTSKQIISKNVYAYGKSSSQNNDEYEDIYDFDDTGDTEDTEDTEDNEENVNMYLQQQQKIAKISRLNQKQQQNYLNIHKGKASKQHQMMEASSAVASTAVSAFHYHSSKKYYQYLNNQKLKEKQRSIKEASSANCENAAPQMGPPLLTSTFHPSNISSLSSKQIVNNLSIESTDLEYDPLSQNSQNSSQNDDDSTHFYKKMIKPPSRSNLSPNLHNLKSSNLNTGDNCANMKTVPNSTGKVKSSANKDNRDLLISNKLQQQQQQINHFYTIQSHPIDDSDFDPLKTFDNLDYFEDSEIVKNNCPSQEFQQSSIPPPPPINFYTANSLKPKIASIKQFNSINQITNNNNNNNNNDKNNDTAKYAHISTHNSLSSINPNQKQTFMPVNTFQTYENYYSNKKLSSNDLYAILKPVIKPYIFNSKIQYNAQPALSFKLLYLGSIYIPYDTLSNASKLKAIRYSIEYFVKSPASRNNSQLKNVSELTTQESLLSESQLSVVSNSSCSSSVNLSSFKSNQNRNLNEDDLKSKPAVNMIVYDDKIKILNTNSNNNDSLPKEALNNKKESNRNLVFYNKEEIAFCGKIKESNQYFAIVVLSQQNSLNSNTQKLTKSSSFTSSTNFNYPTNESSSLTSSSCLIFKYYDSFNYHLDYLNSIDVLLNCVSKVYSNQDSVFNLNIGESEQQNALPQNRIQPLNTNEYLYLSNKDYQLYEPVSLNNDNYELVFFNNNNNSNNNAGGKNPTNYGTLSSFNNQNNNNNSKNKENNRPPVSPLSQSLQSIENNKDLLEKNQKQKTKSGSKLKDQNKNDNTTPNQSCKKPKNSGSKLIDSSKKLRLKNTLKKTANSKVSENLKNAILSNFDAEQNAIKPSSSIKENLTSLFFSQNKNKNDLNKSASNFNVNQVMMNDSDLLKQIEIETQKNLQQNNDKKVLNDDLNNQQQQQPATSTKFSFSTLLSSKTGPNGSIKIKKTSQAFQFLKSKQNGDNNDPKPSLNENEDFFDPNQILNSLEPPASASRRLSLPFSDQQNSNQNANANTTNKSTAKRLFMNLINSVTQNIHHSNEPNSNSSSSPLNNSNKASTLRKIHQLQNGAQRRLSDYHRPIKASLKRIAVFFLS